MTITDAPRCQNPACGCEITVIRGHRARKYCNDNCKQAAYLARLDAIERARRAAEEAERLRKEMEMLTQRWGDLLPETLLQLKKLKDRAGITTADQLVAVIKAEVAQQQQQGVETQHIAELEREIEHLNKRISKQYERRIAKQQARIEELEEELEEQLAQQSINQNKSDRGTMAARLMIVAERLHYCRLLVPHINPGVESWQHFVEQASIDQLSEAVGYAEHYYGNLIYLDELEQQRKQEARAKKAS